MYSAIDCVSPPRQGRDTSNRQDMRSNCTTRGARSLCHRCEDFLCEGPNGPAICPYQLQGVNLLADNIPTVTDVPFALGPNVSHR